MKTLKARYQGYMYNGTENGFTDSIVYVDTENPSPDPFKRLLWGKTLYTGNNFRLQRPL